ncbi:hypothetical protein VTL71DRAFT_4144 [Oculimacula yallundae]|uniref:Uncharacterized protein n=1 Tax=Oculimacula yallundae TaxID=86028 RepID=A0ABR4C4Z3_9HELO
MSLTITLGDRSRVEWHALAQMDEWIAKHHHISVKVDKRSKNVLSRPVRAPYHEILKTTAKGESVHLTNKKCR